MFESLKHAVNIPAILVTLSSFGVVGAGGLWLVHRRTGRPYRDMVAVLLGGVVLVITTLPMIILFDSYSQPPMEQRWLARQVQTALFLAFTLLVWWAFNRWGKRGSRSSGRGQRKTPHIAP